MTKEFDRAPRKTGFAALDGMAHIAESFLLDRFIGAVKGALEPELLFERRSHGVTRPETFSPTFSEGGKSRFLPALAIAVAAVDDDPEVTPRRVFSEVTEHLRAIKRPTRRSDKISSTRKTVERLAESGISSLSGVEIAECSDPQKEPTARREEAFIPISDEKSALLVPMSWLKLSELEETRTELVRVPLWSAVTGAETEKSITHASRSGHIDPDSIKYALAYPVRPRGSESDEGIHSFMPGSTFIKAFCEEQFEFPPDMSSRVPEFIPPQPNIAYRVSAV